MNLKEANEIIHVKLMGRCNHGRKEFMSDFLPTPYWWCEDCGHEIAESELNTYDYSTRLQEVFGKMRDDGLWVYFLLWMFERGKTARDLASFHGISDEQQTILIAEYLEESR